jgi:hypothetical protein
MLWFCIVEKIVTLKNCNFKKWGKNMRKAMIFASITAAISLGITAPALSHHSHAMFDHTAEETITGTVADFAYRNPHVFLYVDVEGENDETLNYWIEMSNIPIMIRRGIGAGTFKTGDEVTVNFWPLKDGRAGGNYTTIIAADGTEYD